MPSIDLSRFATDFRKHYDSVRMQQGRVLSEDDFNEGARLDQEDERRTRIHVIGAAGSPDGGFLISNPTAGAGGAAFTIGKGTLYDGGLRLELQEAESYVAQHDWLRPALRPRVSRGVAAAGHGRRRFGAVRGRARRRQLDAHPHDAARSRAP